MFMKRPRLYVDLLSLIIAGLYAAEIEIAMERRQDRG